MEEWDLESYRRKFLSTKAVYREVETGNLLQDYVHEFTNDDNDRTVAKLGTGKWWLMAGEDKEAEFVYYPITSGVFLCNKPNHFMLVMRRHIKTFQVGLGSGFNTYGYDSVDGQIQKNLTNVDLLTPVPEYIYTGRNYGFLNKYFWWATDKLFYLTTLVGYIKNPETVVITRPEYAAIVKRAWKNPCQTPAL